MHHLHRCYSVGPAQMLCCRAYRSSTMPGLTSSHSSPSMAPGKEPMHPRSFFQWAVRSMHVRKQGIHTFSSLFNGSACMHEHFLEPCSQENCEVTGGEHEKRVRQPSLDSSCISTIWSLSHSGTDSWDLKKRSHSGFDELVQRSSQAYTQNVKTKSD